ncbi:MAG TPA: hypothetical protein VKA53_05320, partial [Thermoanaerobaculia bacterium]|nr:hypothetical protein [Thermoanaerobaculia bacterium]
PDPEECSHEYEVPLDPLPCWAHNSAGVVRRKVAELIESIEEEVAAVRLKQGAIRVLGVEEILAQTPEARPKALERRPAPLVHAASRRKRREFLGLYSEFLQAFYAAVERMREGVAEYSFPAGAFLPSTILGRPG